MVKLELIKKCKSVLSIHFAKSKIPFKSELKINTDSRKFAKGESFIALVGENFDGFNYAESVLEIGAKVIFYQSTPTRDEFVNTLCLFYPETVFVGVQDTLIFLQELASCYRLEWSQKNKKRKIIGVTGSNGKTTHKEMISFLLNEIFPGKVLATKGNLNNHIGVPLTLLSLKNHHMIAIVEMGMNHQGEIKVLCDIAKPEHGMITNIGAAHIEFLKSMDNIFKEKGTLYDEVVKNSKGKGHFVVNFDDTYLAKLKRSKGLCGYGESSGDIRINMNSSETSFNIFGKSLLISNKNISEKHNLKNLAGVAIFCLQLFPEKLKNIISAANKYEQPSMNRSQWIENIYLDAYNANPSSMRVSLSSFVTIMKEKNVSLDDCYFVLGDMNELGEFAEKMHQDIAQETKNLGIKNISFIGRYKEFYLKGQPNPTSHHQTKESFHEEWKKVRKKYKFIFVKASRSLQLESLMTIL
jgi:UDP-N-acetylmuramoyl-tripeptide--D-alanyl-D-alanine ligase